MTDERLHQAQGSHAPQQPRPMRSLLIVLVALGFVALTAGMWLTDRARDPAVFNWYSSRWFVLAIVLTVLLGVASFCAIRALRSATAIGITGRSGMSLRRKLLFSGLVLTFAVAAVEFSLRHLIAEARLVGQGPAESRSTAHHAFLQRTTRMQIDGQWVRSFRGRSHQRTKTTRFRIVCLGGSTTWGYGTPAESSWPLLAERILAERGYDVEVINAGYLSYTTAHSVVNYSLFMRYYNADVVVVMHGINDLHRSFPAAGELPTEWDYGSFQGPLRHLLTREQPAQPTVLSALSPLLPWACWQFWCDFTGFDFVYYSLLRNRRGTKSPRAAHEDASAKPARPTSPRVIDGGAEAFTTLDSMAAHLDYLAQLCEADGVVLIPATQANTHSGSAVQVSDLPYYTPGHTAQNLRQRVRISPETMAAGFAAVRKIVVELAQRRGLTVADFERAIDGRAEYFVDAVHLNQAGNEIVAQSMVETLLPVLDTIRTQK